MVRLLCLTADAALIRQVGAIFADMVINVTCETTVNKFLVAADSQPFDAYFLDFDLLTQDNSPREAISKLVANDKVLVASSTSIAEWRKSLPEDAILLHKPITAGEVGVALRRLVL